MKNARPQTSEASALEPRRNCIASLVELDHAEARTTSLLVAEKFDKRHDTVLRAIGNLECSDEFRARNFAVAEYFDEQGKPRPMYRITRDGFAFLAMGFTGRSAAQWKERFIDAFNQIERELRRIATQRALPDWQEARQIGKTDRRVLTDTVQALAERAHMRGDSTTPVALWQTAATRTVTTALFESEFRESIAGIRDRLTARQLRRLALAEDVFANTIVAHLDHDLHHRVINDEAKRAVQTFAAVTGGREVSGVDRRPMLGQRGFIAPHLMGLLAVSTPAVAALAAIVWGWLA